MMSLLTVLGKEHHRSARSQSQDYPREAEQPLKSSKCESRLSPTHVDRKKIEITKGNVVQTVKCTLKADQLRSMDEDELCFEPSAPPC